MGPNHTSETRPDEKSSRSGPQRQRLERRLMEGMILHQDGSTHAWIPVLDFNMDLSVTIDDATSEITSGFLVAQEGTGSREIDQ